MKTAQWQEAIRQPIVAIKLGGSLLTLPNLIERLEWLLARREGARAFIICGGGSAADTVRLWQKLHGISDLDAHCLALDAMAFNEQLLRSALPHSDFARSVADLSRSWTVGMRPILRVRGFLTNVAESTGELLPTTWDVSSDSIAGWCGAHIGADELILAKSTDLPEATTFAAARTNGLVDQAFATLDCPDAVTWVNLRAEHPRLIEWD